MQHSNVLCLAFSYYRPCDETDYLSVVRDSILKETVYRDVAGELGLFTLSWGS